MELCFKFYLVLSTYPSQVEGLMQDFSINERYNLCDYAKFPTNVFVIANKQ